ncbi:MAG: ATP-binding cassette domain-containing protein [Spirochaetaceae bacterium]|jgi:D-methionine transport system ATP-binding protein|nr:ATP-binding cassette domain-containing protein [Spirochaetaceae bacterium]
MIQLNNINKVFHTDSGVVQAVKNVTLSVEEGDICGVIGFSGAGKSTLIRCINLLERPDSGEVLVNQQNLMNLAPAELRAARKNIGMIFQHFNLFRSRTVADNIAYPLRYTGMSKNDITKRVRELIEIVDLGGKEHAYPSQLSGGQKQRVGIARALACKPKVLLCDEATSALDPQTTQSILELLKNLNKKFGFTIIIVTHEMNIVRSICARVAVMAHGEIIERGSTFSIFSNPETLVTKKFIATTSNLYKIYNLIENNSPLVALQENQLLAHFSYIGDGTFNSLISTASRNFNVNINIIFGDLDIIQDKPAGGLINIIEGDTPNIEKTLAWFRTQGVRVEVLKNGNQ